MDLFKRSTLLCFLTLCYSSVFAQGYKRGWWFETSGKSEQWVQGGYQDYYKSDKSELKLKNETLSFDVFQSPQSIKPNGNFFKLLEKSFSKSQSELIIYQKRPYRGSDLLAIDSNSHQKISFKDSFKIFQCESYYFETQKEKLPLLSIEDCSFNFSIYNQMVSLINDPNLQKISYDKLKEKASQEKKRNQQLRKEIQRLKESLLQLDDKTSKEEQFLNERTLACTKKKHQLEARESQIKQYFTSKKWFYLNEFYDSLKEKLKGEKNE